MVVKKYFKRIWLCLLLTLVLGNSLDSAFAHPTLEEMGTAEAIIHDIRVDNRNPSTHLILLLLRFEILFPGFLYRESLSVGSDYLRHAISGARLNKDFRSLFKFPLFQPIQEYYEINGGVSASSSGTATPEGSPPGSPTFYGFASVVGRSSVRKKRDAESAFKTLIGESKMTKVEELEEEKADIGEDGLPVMTQVVGFSDAQVVSEFEMNRAAVTLLKIQIESPVYLQVSHKGQLEKLYEVWELENSWNQAMEYLKQNPPEPLSSSCCCCF